MNKALLLFTNVIISPHRFSPRFSLWPQFSLVVKVDYWLVRAHSKDLLLFTVSESNKDELSVVLLLGKPALKSESINRSGFKCEQFNPVSVCPRGIWTLLTHLQLLRLPFLLILCIFPPFCFFCSLIHHCWLSWWLFPFLYTREGPGSCFSFACTLEKGKEFGSRGKRQENESSWRQADIPNRLILLHDVIRILGSNDALGFFCSLMCHCTFYVKSMQFTSKLHLPLTLIFWVQILEKHYPVNSYELAVKCATIVISCVCFLVKKHNICKTFQTQQRKWTVNRTFGASRHWNLNVSWWPDWHLSWQFAVWEWILNYQDKFHCSPQHWWLQTMGTWYQYFWYSFICFLEQMKEYQKYQAPICYRKKIFLYSTHRYWSELQQSHSPIRTDDRQ